MLETPIKGKVALITGASRGIGKATALALAKEGVHTALVARTKSDLDELQKQCESFGVKSKCFYQDLSEVQTLESLVQNIKKQMGNISILVNNAGKFGRGSVKDVDLSIWDDVIDVNLRSIMHLTRLTMPQLIESCPSTVINIASVASMRSFANAGVYSATKHALRGFGGCVFEDVREAGVKVCTLMPGYVATRMTEVDYLEPKKMIQPEDIAATVIFVAKFAQTGCPTEIVIRPQKDPTRS